MTHIRTLANGVTIPLIGLGVWKMPDNEATIETVSSAIKDGYRMIDTAAIYGNERSVGRALKQSGVPREDLFITTKLWNDSHHYDDALSAFRESLGKLDCGYVDLYLIHWPMPQRGLFHEAWRALERLYLEGSVKAIGVSNFTTEHLEELIAEADIMPMVNQIELHPWFQQRDTRRFCEDHTIAIESYSPLMHGGEVLADPAIVGIASKHNKSAAQVILRWHIHHGFVAIPKSMNPTRIAENFDVFDFELSEDDMTAIDNLDQGHRINQDPDSAVF